MTAEDHERRAGDHADAHPPRVAVVTISDSRTLAEDRSGDAAIAICREAGFTLADRRLVPDDPHLIGRLVDDLASEAAVDAIVLLGGTGIGPRDRTPDVVGPRLARELPGIGEQVRALGMRDVGPAAILSRAIGGVIGDDGTTATIVFVLPGSTRAVESIMQELVAPLLPHAIWELRGRP